MPRLNTVTPVGVQAPRGKKKGKVFVDSGESMMTILAMVNADKEGQIESKMMKAVSGLSMAIHGYPWLSMAVRVAVGSVPGADGPPPRRGRWRRFERRGRRRPRLDRRRESQSL